MKRFFLREEELGIQLGLEPMQYIVNIILSGRQATQVALPRSLSQLIFTLSELTSIYKV